MELIICFSVQVNSDIKKLARRFSASESISAYSQFKTNVEIESKLGLAETEKLLGLKRHPKRKPPIFKTPDASNRIYSNYFSNVIVMKNGKRTLVPMRYRVRPNGSENEVPSKYNLFNARIDALEQRKTWNPLFMRNHGLFPFVQFYEWVMPNKKAKEIIFKPNSSEIMWAPCIWDEWQSKDGQFNFKSFAIITDEPPTEILEKGHDRCPIFLKEKYIDEWLKPETKNKNEIYQLLQQKESVKYNFEWA